MEWTLTGGEEPKPQPVTGEITMDGEKVSSLQAAFKSMKDADKDYVIELASDVTGEKTCAPTSSFCASSTAVSSNGDNPCLPFPAPPRASGKAQRRQLIQFKSNNITQDRLRLQKPGRSFLYSRPLESATFEDISNTRLSCLGWSTYARSWMKKARPEMPVVFLRLWVSAEEDRP